MGNIQEKGKAFRKNFAVNYQKVGDVKDTQIGIVSVFQDRNSDQQVAISLYKSEQQQHLDDFINFNGNYIDHQFNDHPNIWKAYAYHMQEQFNLFESISLKVYYEFCFTTLAIELAKRARLDLFYSESDVWIILFSVVSAGSILEQQGRFIGDIRPPKIGLNKAGQLKLPPYKLFPTLETNYNLFLYQNRKSFLAPEQFSDLRIRNPDSKYNRFKADVFSLGMTMLEVAGLVDATACYNYQQITLNMVDVRNMLLLVKEKYSDFLFNLINRLLDINPDTRPSHTQIYNLLQPYEVQIRQSQPFQFTTNDLQKLNFYNNQVIYQTTQPDQQNLQEIQQLQQQSQPTINQQQTLLLSPKSNNNEFNLSYSAIIPKSQGSYLPQQNQLLESQSNYNEINQEYIVTQNLQQQQQQVQVQNIQKIPQQNANKSYIDQNQIQISNQQNLPQQQFYYVSPRNQASTTTRYYLVDQSSNYIQPQQYYIQQQNQPEQLLQKIVKQEKDQVQLMQYQSNQNNQRIIYLQNPQSSNQQLVYYQKQTVNQVPINQVYVTPQQYNSQQYYQL